MKEYIKQIIINILNWEAEQVLKRRKPFVIAVTGNLGKTSTKDAIVAVMSSSFDVRGSAKSNNSEWGIPLTILGLETAWGNPFVWMSNIIKGFFTIFDGDYPTHLVLEIGADKPGDILSVSKWLHPDIVVVTQFGQVPVHIEFFADRDAVVKEKEYLVKALKPDGVFIWNADDHDGVLMSQRFKGKTMSVGISKAAHVKAGQVDLYGTPYKGTHSLINVAGTGVNLSLSGVIGYSPIYAALPALAVANLLNISMQKAAHALESAERPRGRMCLLPGKNNSLLIDDTYNASPKAVEHGLHTLASLDAKRKIAVIGDMLELGQYSSDEHFKIGQKAAKSCHILIAAGIRSVLIAEGAKESGMRDGYILQCESALDAALELSAIIKDGDIVYIKGSQGMRMERVVEKVLSPTLQASDVLVRQEREWLSKRD